MNVKAKCDYVFGDEQWLVKGNEYTVDEVINTIIKMYVIEGQIYNASWFEESSKVCDHCNR